MSRRIIGIDLGAYSVKLCRLQCGKQTPKFEIMNIAEIVLPAASNGEEPEPANLQKEALLRLFAQGLLEAEVAASGLPAQFGQMRTMEVPFLDNRKLEAVLPGLLEAEMPFDINGMIVSWYHTLLPPTSSQAGQPEFATINVALGKKSAISETLQLLQTSSINPRLFHLSSTAPFELIRELNADVFFDNHLSSVGHELGAFIDFGHQATNLCIFSRTELKYARSFLRGGKKLTEEIASALDISLDEAQRLKHERVDLTAQVFNQREDRVINEIAMKHYGELAEDILRTLIALKTNGLGEVKAISFIGGGAKSKGVDEQFTRELNNFGVRPIRVRELVGGGEVTESTALAFAYALSCIQIHEKESRFNFRKDEFTWRGDLEYLRTRSTPLLLWLLVLVCSLTIMWSASSLVLDKENRHVENQLKTVCLEILKQKNIAPKKCLAQMKEQIAANVGVGIPEFSSSDVYVKIAETIPKDLNVTFTEMDISDKKLRITAKTASFENVDKVVDRISKIPCFVNVEKGRARQMDGTVEFQLNSDVDCGAARQKIKAKP